MDRIHRNYRFIVGFNLGLILGVVGILPPTTSALLHNASTLGISLKSMTDLLPEPEAAATVPERSGEDPAAGNRDLAAGDFAATYLLLFLMEGSPCGFAAGLPSLFIFPHRGKLPQIRNTR